MLSQEDLLRLENYILAECPKSLQFFLDVVIIESSHPTKFKTLREKDPWQQKYILEPLVPAVECAAGVRPYKRGQYRQWFLLTMPRGHAKTTIQALLSIWLLLFSKRHTLITVAASDQKQADEVRKSIQSIVRSNWWMQNRIDIQNFVVKGQKGELEIISSDALSGYGKRRHLYICDEFTSWGQNQPLYNTLFSGADKIEDACFVITSNAGIIGSWQHEVLKTAMSMPDFWYVWEAPGHLASWMSQEVKEAKRKTMLPSEARRVLDNRWILPTEAGEFVLEQEIDRCENLSRELDLSYQYTRPVSSNNRYVVGFDYGCVNDRCVGVLLHRNEVRNVYQIDRMDIWQGTRDKPVPIEIVENWIEDIYRRFSPRLLVIDPWQLEGTYQKFVNKIPIEKFENARGVNNYKMAELLRKCIVNTQLAWYQDCGVLQVSEGKWENFSDELLALQVKVMSYGWRLDHLSSMHDDRAVAVGMALFKLEETMPHLTDLCITQVQRPFVSREMYGVERPTRDGHQKAQADYKKYNRVVLKKPSSAVRRGLYGIRGD